MGWWEDRVVPHLVDASLSQKPVMELREPVCAGLGGRVLEIGFGSGLNLRYFPDQVTSVDAVEPSDLGWQRSERRRTRAAVPVRRVGLDGQDIAAADASYDTALCTFSLCTIPDAERALAEVHRLLVPGGRLHFLEHAAAPEARVRAWQHRLDPMQRTLCGGCHLTRDPVELTVAAGFEVTGVEHTYLAPGPFKPWGYLTWGKALKR